MFLWVDFGHTPRIARLFVLGYSTSFYRALNPYIVRRTLGGGRKRVVFAAPLKLLIPFLIVAQGIQALNLFGQDLLTAEENYDYLRTLGVLARNVVKPYPLIFWLVPTARFLAVVSFLASMLNPASTFATMDLYAKATGGKSVQVGRGVVVLSELIAARTVPLKTPAIMSLKTTLALESSPRRRGDGFVVVGLLILLYVIS